MTSAAVEDNVPDVVRARELGLAHLTRPQFLASLLNSAQRSVAVGGTSGKSTVTGMIGWILHACHRQPTVMNGAVMKNFVTPSAPFASALVGDPQLFVSEVDESDGSIALYRPEIAVLTNISLDHKEMDELRNLFNGFLGAARKAVLNLDDPEVRALAGRCPKDKLVGYGFDSPAADIRGKRRAAALQTGLVSRSRRAMSAIRSSFRFPACTMHPMRWPRSQRRGRLGFQSPTRPRRSVASAACGEGSRRSAKPAE